jgi:hypothetical protein
MPTTTRQVLQLSFDTETAGKTYTMSFRNPKTTLTALEINAVAADLISKNIILAPGGALTALNHAAIVDTDTNDLV